MAVRFGTDGWRGIIGEDYTFANVRACAQGTADYLKQAGMAGRGVVIGYDTRFASEDFAAAAAEVLAGNGAKVFLCARPTPTPVTVFATLQQGAGAGIVITASHNPYPWNGFKLRAHDGTAITEETARHIEGLVVQALSQPSRRIPLAQAVSQGLVEHYDPRPQYLAQLTSLAPVTEIKNRPLTAVIDPMFGAGMGYLRELLSGGKLRLQEIHGERNPLFPGLVPEPIPANLVSLGAAVKQAKAQIGLATDGDADRVGVVDERGTPLSAPQVFALLALYFLEVRGLRGTIVKSLPSTAMLDKLAQLYSVPLVSTPVGFKHIAPYMNRDETLIGGEESGGYSFRGHVPERDGIMASLYFLDLVGFGVQSLSQWVEYLYNKVGYHYYERWDLRFPEGLRGQVLQRLQQAHPDRLDGVAVAQRDTRDGFYFLLSDGSWLMLRFSGTEAGTEALLRLYAESTTPGRVERLLEQGKALAGV